MDSDYSLFFFQTHLSCMGVNVKNNRPLHNSCKEISFFDPDFHWQMHRLAFVARSNHISSRSIYQSLSFEFFKKWPPLEMHNHRLRPLGNNFVSSFHLLCPSLLGVSISSLVMVSHGIFEMPASA